MSKSKIFLVLCVSFIFGILLASLMHLPRQGIYLFLAVAIAWFAVSFIFKYQTSALLGLILISLGCGALRLNFSFHQNSYQDLFGEKVKLEGYIIEDIDLRQNKQLLTFRPKNSSQNILITADLQKEFAYGDWVVAEGKIKEPENFDDFDYQKYLERYNVYAAMSYPHVLILKSHQQNLIKDRLLLLKHWFTAHMEKLLPQPQAALLMGILIGAKKSLPQNVLDDFSRTGISHIIAISGYNISIIIAALEFLARYLGRRASFLSSLLVILAFVILAGPSASVVRAAIMGGLLLLSFNLGRQYAVLPALLFSAAMMLIINPRILYWDIGFQLSFLATLGIVLVVPRLETLTQGWPNFLELKSIIFTTLAAIVFTLPAILLYFDRLSLISPLANLVVLPFVPWTMLLGFLAALPFFGQGLAFVASYLLSFILRTAHFLAQLPFASVEIKISGLTFVLLYLAVALGYFWLVWAERRYSEKLLLKA